MGVDARLGPDDRKGKAIDGIRARRLLQTGFSTATAAASASSLVSDSPRAPLELVRLRESDGLATAPSVRPPSEILLLWIFQSGQATMAPLFTHGWPFLAPVRLLANPAVLSHRRRRLVRRRFHSEVIHDDESLKRHLRTLSSDRSFPASTSSRHSSSLSASGCRISASPAGWAM